MKTTVIIGAGGVGNVVAQKCAQDAATFGTIWLASRTLEKCNAIAADIKAATGVEIHTAKVDADNVAETAAFLKKVEADFLLNIALPYQDLTLMEACLEAGVHYLDTANYESPENPHFEYKQQWEFQDRFEKAGLTAILGSGFDPGVTNVFCSYALKHFFSEIRTVDIIDANAGDHGLPFATNFSPEINIREITAPGRYWEKGEWKETSALSVSTDFEFPHDEIGTKKIYLLHHEEMESLALNLPGLERIRFWMTFSENYINHLTVLENVGMTAIEPIMIGDTAISPLQFLQKVLPDPASLGPLTKGKTCIGCLITGKCLETGEEKTKFIYNICDHQECFAEVKSQAISYTAGVPAMIGGRQLISGAWLRPGVWNLEQLDPDPFMDDLNAWGLPWHVLEVDRELSL
ncbi:saccharopine dehydrogenase family protein [bacterium]|nr:saccharopine dehydrogenase family protein [Akkermansiaceae bacterium]MDB4429680.1 saccharopine dehydrogenase family protein [Akkermansiaceae bacterium]MDB4504403.1 saccharopine dehydrogenase family protein [Akkermansiaceae bacterium]MDB4547226.1 saccharopine dehydrogenase family protein [Akkermansiaceae bacterium]MDB4588152.1 saccharopine dehydrogenase family protein [bacterium]